MFTTQTTLIAQTTNAIGSEASEKEIKQVIQNMFQAMLQADTSSLRICFSDKVIFQTIVNKPEGVMINTESINDFIKSIGKQTPNALDERIEFGAIQIDPLMAMPFDVIGDKALSTQDHLFKLIIIGDTGVGKSCLMKRVMDNEFK